MITARWAMECGRAIGAGTGGTSWVMSLMVAPQVACKNSPTGGAWKPAMSEDNVVSGRRRRNEQRPVQTHMCHMWVKLVAQ